MKKNKDDKLKTLFSILWFLLKLNLLAIPLYVLLALNFSLPQLQSGLAHAVAGILNLSGYRAVVQNYYIIIYSGSVYATFEISMDCTAWKSMYLLAALSIATPSDLRNKLKFLAIALPSIFLINYVRILTTIVWAFQYGFQYLDIVHTFLWREGLIFAVLGIWYIWFRRSSYNIRKPKIRFRWKFG